jgi:glycosyltransferase involved in cell wall biosynthesis
MKVTVSLITYNHAPFIRQAIDSVLMQQTDFDYELLIGEDESTDGTREIVAEYAARHPQRIRVIYNRRKDVVYYNGRPTGQFNFINNIRNAGGQYVALLEGDDYWTDPRKLQKQADLLDSHPEYAMCFHGVDILRDDGQKYPFKLGLKKPRHTLENFLRSECHIQTASTMLRNHLFQDIPNWYWRMCFGDLPLYVLQAEHGDIGFIDEVMAVYRIHAGGIWSQGNGFGQWMNPETVTNNWRLIGMVDFYEAVNRHLDFKYDVLLRDKISMWCYALVWAYRVQGDRTQMNVFLKKALKAKLFNSHTPVAFVIKSLLHAYLPFVYAPLARLKKSRPAGNKS